MKTHDFWFDLPEELIAQTPLQQRDSSRMLKLDRATGAVEHRHFYDIIEYLQPGDCLVIQFFHNDDSFYRSYSLVNFSVR